MRLFKDTILSAGFWFLAISGIRKVSLITVCEWRTGVPTVLVHGSLFWFPGSTLWHYSSRIIVVCCCLVILNSAICQLPIKIWFRFICFFSLSLYLNFSCYILWINQTEVFGKIPVEIIGGDSKVTGCTVMNPFAHFTEMFCTLYMPFWFVILSDNYIRIQIVEPTFVAFGPVVVINIFTHLWECDFLAWTSFIFSAKFCDIDMICCIQAGLIFE